MLKGSILSKLILYLYCKELKATNLYLNLFANIVTFLLNFSIMPSKGIMTIKKSCCISLRLYRISCRILLRALLLSVY